jgi:hypothetical protein
MTAIEKKGNHFYFCFCIEMKLYLCHFQWKLDCIYFYLYASLVNLDWEGKQISCFYSDVTKDDADVMFSLEGKFG